MNIVPTLLRWHSRGHHLGSRWAFLVAQIYRDEYVAANNYQQETNGEFRLLQALRNERIRTVFDIGANVGKYTATVLRELNEAEVHAFEISPIIYEQLKTNLGTQSRAHLVNYGLSDSEAKKNFHQVDENSELSGLGERPYSVSSRIVEGKTIRGDSYAKRAGIDAVDLVKIDVEGFEIEVIGGMSGILENIKLVQFEYNEMSWKRGIFLGHFQNALPNFQIGRLTQGGVIWDLSLLSNAHFCVGNMIAINSRCAGLKGALSKFQFV